MGIGGFIGRTAAVAAGNVAATYAVRGVDSAVDGRRMRQGEALPAVMAQLQEHYIQMNCLPGDAASRAQGLCHAATERLRTSGYLGRGPIGDYFIQNHEDYCAALMQSEGVRVAEIRDWWNTNEYWREVFVLLKEEAFNVTMQSAVSQGWTPNNASLCAWKLVPVYGKPDLGPGRDVDYSPLPPELYPRVEEFLSSHAHPFAGASESEALQRPSLNGWVRQYVTGVVAQRSVLNGPQPQLPG